MQLVNIQDLMSIAGPQTQILKKGKMVKLVQSYRFFYQLLMFNAITLAWQILHSA